mmetsp:Transcript_29555/g.68738  ORF Transcript_29555/g.68738 Transcript_29555/m.68738 type:complete len:241 (+) Transcript_29555:461-1183(+)
MLGNAIRVVRKIHVGSAVAQQPRDQASACLLEVELLVNDSAVDVGERAQAHDAEPVGHNQGELDPDEEDRQVLNDLLLVQVAENPHFPEAHLHTAHVPDAHATMQAQGLAGFLRDPTPFCEDRHARDRAPHVDVVCPDHLAEDVVDWAFAAVRGVEVHNQRGTREPHSRPFIDADRWATVPLVEGQPLTSLTAIKGRCTHQVFDREIHSFTLLEACGLLTICIEEHSDHPLVPAIRVEGP